MTHPPAEALTPAPQHPDRSALYKVQAQSPQCHWRWNIVTSMKLLTLFAVLSVTLSLTESLMVCYYGSWAVYRQGDGKFDVEDIDPGICTHLVFGFAGLGHDNRIRVLDSWNELCDNYGKCAFDRFTALKQKNKDLITLLAVGGWNEGSAKYSKMAKSAANRKIFIDSSIELLKAHNFDGLDMDWEYPTQRGGAPEDKANFVILLRELKEALHANGMILTAAVSAGKATIDAAYDIPGMAQHLDLMNLMAYDLHGAWDDYTHHQSGLYAHPMDTGDNVYLNQDFAVNYWIEGGMPSTKITLGVPLYGRCWSLSSEAEHGYYAPATQPGRPGPFTNTPGFMGYNEICVKIKEEGWTVVVEPSCNEPYAYYMPYSRIWCSYDDHDSVAIKPSKVSLALLGLGTMTVGRLSTTARTREQDGTTSGYDGVALDPTRKDQAAYAKDKNLAGMMVWSIETDDFLAKCHNRDFDLIKTMVETFTGTDIGTPIPQPTTTPDPNKPTTTPHTTPNTPPPEGVCQKPGINADPDNCHHYWLCSPNTSGSYDAVEEPCAPNTLFNPLTLICDWDYTVCALENICVNDCP